MLADAIGGERAKPLLGVALRVTISTANAAVGA
jgi:hypothetical protein